jgi:hypothetical protein
VEWSEQTLLFEQDPYEAQIKIIAAQVVMIFFGWALISSLSDSG